MIRLILILIFALLISIYTVFDAIVCFFIEKLNKDAIRKHSIRVVKFIFKVVIFISGSKIHVKGKENIESLSNEQAYLVISNHRGFFDIISGYLLFDKDTGIVAKNSIEKVPVISYWMKRIECIFLDRDNLRDGVRMVIKAIENINNGISMWIFPEGTRSKGEDPLDMLEFKAGSFKIAEKKDCYILPMSFRNTEKVFENQKPFVKPADVYINIGKAYRMSELSDDDRKNIAVYSQEKMKKLLTEGQEWQKQ